ncbi:MAG: UDP-N-acetylmuramate--L-alanine ligase [Euryarchaeota archaeon]|nr:UDP-N-acetylmuramate--L-alanine ligase [Euryarchaeota archaeon]
MNLSKFSLKNIHFVGIGGSGMSGIAEVLFNLGYKVSGSDKKESDITKRLRDLGIEIQYEHAESNLNEAEMVVVSSAISESNPEIKEAKKRSIPILARAEMLSSLMNTKRGIAIAGTHGKTTTTSIIASIMTEADLDPTFINGGIINSFNSNAQLGKGRYLIAEADESDQSFLLLQPSASIITNIEPDHLVNYENSFEKLKMAFLDFIKKLPFNGMAIVCGDDPVIRELIPRFSRPYITYGFTEDNDYVLSKYSSRDFQSSFNLRSESENLDLSFNMLGRHNALNAAAAAVLCIQEGIPTEVINNSLKNFMGISRRMQVLVELSINGSDCVLVDDYGHHPSEIKSTIDSIRESFPNRELNMVFQPHRYSRTNELFSEFVDVLSQVDNLILLDIYSAGESPIKGVDSKELVVKIIDQGFEKVKLLNSQNEIIRSLEGQVKNDSVLIMQGAGNISEVSHEIKKKYLG